MVKVAQWVGADLQLRPEVCEGRVDCEQGLNKTAGVCLGLDVAQGLENQLGLGEPGVLGAGGRPALLGVKEGEEGGEDMARCTDC